MVTKATTSEKAEELRRHVHRFLRCFGGLAGDVTPCGQPLPVSYAHALLILLQLGRQRPTMSELTEKLRIDKSNVTRLCRRMQDDGHIEFERSADDGRVRRLRLTVEGRKLARRVDRSSRQRFENILSHVTDERIDDVLSGLDALGDAIDRMVSKESSA